MDEMDMELISKLKFISKLRPGQKINTHSMTIQEDTYYNSIIRTIFSDNRENAINMFKSILDKSYDTLKSLKQRNQQDLFALFVKNITACITGLKAFKDTYKNDSLTTSKVEVIIDKIKLVLHSFNVPDIQTPVDEENVTEDDDIKPIV